MNVLVALKNSYTTSIPNVHWHPSFTAHLEVGFDHHVNAGCWIRKSDLEKYNQKYNVNHAMVFPSSHVNRTVDELIDLIDYAEVPFEILDDDTETPWKNFGDVVKTIGFGGSDDFWNNHA